MPDHSVNPDLVTGLEWEDPLHRNRLAASEHRRLCVLLTKIAQTVRLREIVLRPYFQDYELVAKNVGTVTMAHFSRVLHFLGILVSEVDFTLLVKRFIKDSYTVNYLAFVNEVEQIVKYLDRFRLIDHSQVYTNTFFINSIRVCNVEYLLKDFVQSFPGRLLDAELPKLPRPEIGQLNIGQVFGKETSFHPVLRSKCVDTTVETVIYLNTIRKTLYYKVRMLNADYAAHPATRPRQSDSSFGIFSGF